MLRLLLLALCLLFAVSVSPCSSLDENELHKLFKKAHSRAIAKEKDSCESLGLSIKIAPCGNGPKSKPLSLDKLSGVRLHSNANVPQKVVMVATTYTLDEVHAFLDVLAQMNDSARAKGEETVKLHLMVSAEDVLSDLYFPRQLFDELAEVNHQALCNDLWTQDFGEIATFYVKDGGPPKLGLIDAKKSGDLAFFTEALSSLWSWGWMVPPGLDDDDQGNFGGNIEVTPDDILIIGSTASPALREAFSALGYRSRVAVMDTSWLEVGHVDEIISFLPKPETPLGYVALVASPMLGLELLRSIPEDQITKKLDEVVQNAYVYYPLYPQGFDTEDTEKLEKLVVKLGQLYSHLKGRPTSDAQRISKIVKFNVDAAALIDQSVEELKDRLRILRGNKAELEVIKVPALFETNEEDYGMALVPSMVNHVVLNKQIVVPHPFIDLFLQCTSARLWSLGYVPYFFPSLTYHFLEGQIHCGSNVIRYPNKFVHPRYSLRRQLKL